MPGTLTVTALVSSFLATILLLLVCVSVPTWRYVSFLDVKAPNEQTTRFGVFGYTGSKTSVGYRIDSAGIGFVVSKNESDTLFNLTKILIFHPIGACFACLSALSGIFGIFHRSGIIVMNLFIATATLFTFVAFAVDMALFGIARDHFRARAAHAQYGAANWLTLIAIAALGIGFFGSTCDMFRRYRRHK